MRAKIRNSNLETTKTEEKHYSVASILWASYTVKIQNAFLLTFKQDDICVVFSNYTEADSPLGRS